MRYFIYLLLLGLITSNCSSPPPTKKIEKLESSSYVPRPARITAKPILNFREKPDANSQVIDSIPEGYVIYTLARTEGTETIANYESYWYKAKFKKKVGWLFGKYLDFEEKEVSISKLIQGSSKHPQYPTNYKKLRKYFEANMITKDYKQVLAEFGKPSSQLKFKGSNPHGGYNTYLELLYPNSKLKFIDQFLFEITFFNSESLKNKTIQIGSELHDLELEFEIPYYISKDKFSYLTCFPYSEECPTGYPNMVTFQLEDQKVKSIGLTVYLD